MVGDQNGSFASINAYKSVSRAAVGGKQIMHPAAEDKSLLGLLRSFVCSQGQNKETHHTLKNECEKHLTWQL